MVSKSGGDAEFIERLKLAIGDQSVRSFAISAGLTPSALRSYVTGVSDPTRRALQLIASSAGVTLDWLVAGTGPMRSMSSQSLDSGLLLDLMKGYVRLAKSKGMQVEPDQMAEWATLRYSMIVNSGSLQQSYPSMIEMALAELTLAFKASDS